MEHFNDERINAQCGGIYRRGIAIASGVTLLFGILRAQSIASQGQMSLVYFFTELAILLDGGVILLIDLFLYRFRKEERIEAERARFSLGAGKWFLVISLAGYAASLPFSWEKPFSDVPVNHLIVMLQVLGTLYLFYTFKTRKINFNYSFIDRPSRDYYRAVFERITNLAWMLFVAFFFSAMLDFALHRSFAHLFSIFLGYLLSVVGLGLDYLFLSWLEKRAYEEECPKGLGKGVTGAFAVLLTALSMQTALSVLYDVLALGDLSALGGRAGEILASVATARLYAGYLVSLLTAVTLGHFLAQVGHARRVRFAIRTILLLMGFSIVWSFTASFGNVFVHTLEQGGMPDIERINAYVNFLNGVSYFGAAVSVGAVCFFFHALVREMSCGRETVLPAFVQIVCLGMLFAVNYVSFSLILLLIREALLLGGTVVGFLLLHRHSFPSCEDDEGKRGETIKIC